MWSICGHAFLGFSPLCVTCVSHNPTCFDWLRLLREGDGTHTKFYGAHLPSNPTDECAGRGVEVRAPTVKQAGRISNSNVSVAGLIRSNNSDPGQTRDPGLAFCSFYYNVLVLTMRIWIHYSFIRFNNNITVSKSVMLCHAYYGY